VRNELRSQGLGGRAGKTGRKKRVGIPGLIAKGKSFNQLIAGVTTNTIIVGGGRGRSWGPECVGDGGENTPSRPEF